jgi:hypothetical protein
MSDELERLFECVDEPLAPKETYRQAIIEDNCLGKRSGTSRALSYEFLVRLYGLDPRLTILRGLRYLWSRDEAGRPLLALLCAYARDPLMQVASEYLLDLEIGVDIQPGPLEAYLEDRFPGRFSKSTVGSVARNLRSSWTQSGHIKGVRNKTRTRARATAGSVAYAVLLGYLLGERGTNLFETPFTKLLDCSQEEALELAAEAGRRGWINFKRVGAVVEVQFPQLLSLEEMEWVRE